ncbi:hypothetical protein [Kangiella japonica]
MFLCQHGALMRARYSKALLSRPSGPLSQVPVFKPSVCQPLGHFTVF